MEDKNDQELDDIFDEVLKASGEELPSEESVEQSETPDGDKTEPVQSEPAQAQKPPTQAETARKWAGRFDTPEDMERAFVEREQRPPQPPPQQAGTKADEIADLEDSELITLAEHDDADGTKHYQDYFRHKMGSRDLKPFEVKALRDYDVQNGTDLYGEYRDIRSERRTMAKLAPVLGPMAERNSEAAKKEFASREAAMNDETAAEFGKEFTSLQKQSTDVKFVEKVLQQSPFGRTIIETLDRSPALAHRMLLREISMVNRRSAEVEKATKGKKSVRADIGSQATPKRGPDRADTIDDAWDASVGEDA